MIMEYIAMVLGAVFVVVGVGLALTTNPALGGTTMGVGVGMFLLMLNHIRDQRRRR